jgi:CheY-like chemotaxis protein
MKLLIVDDDNDDVLLARAALKSDADWIVLQASDSRSAIAAIKNEKADLCLIDFSYSESARMAHLCALYQVPSIYWTGDSLPGKHRMFIDKSLINDRAGFRQRLLELIGECGSK